MLIGRSVGIELELCGEAPLVARHLAKEGLCNEAMHDYHCSCAECNFSSGLLWRYQRDSTVDGEFITRIMHDWASVGVASKAMSAAIRKANQGTSKHTRRVYANERTGLHVHVGYDYYEETWTDTLLVNYLLFERHIQRLGSGPFADKREGMNITFLNALRERGHQHGQAMSLADGDFTRVARDLRRQIGSDRHIDLNLSGRNATIEFRVFNATPDAQQIELDVRLAVALCRENDPLQRHWPDEFRIPALAIQTLEPPIDIDTFIRSLARRDDQLVALCERQLSRRLEKLPEPPPRQPRRRTTVWTDSPATPNAVTICSQQPHEVDYDDATAAGGYVLDHHGMSLDDCYCNHCVVVRRTRRFPSEPEPSPRNEVVPESMTVTNWSPTSLLCGLMAEQTPEPEEAPEREDPFDAAMTRYWSGHLHHRAAMTSQERSVPHAR